MSNDSILLDVVPCLWVSSYWKLKWYISLIMLWQVLFWTFCYCQAYLSTCTFWQIEFWVIVSLLVVCCWWSLQGWTQRVFHSWVGWGWIQWCRGPSHSNPNRDHHSSYTHPERARREGSSYQGTYGRRPEEVQLPRRHRWSNYLVAVMVKCRLHLT